MRIRQWTKLVVCVLVVSSATALLMCNKVDSAAGVALVSGVLGYVFGNGHGVIESKTKQPVSGGVD